MFIFGAIIMVAATIAFIVLPLTQTDMSEEEPLQIDFTLAELEEEKENSYFAIKEAEFDYKTGKLSDEDFEIVKNQYSKKAVETMKKLEKHKKQSTEEKSSDNFCSGCGSELKEGLKFCPSCGARQKKIKTNMCPACGSKYKKGDKFCDKCGKKI